MNNDLIPYDAGVFSSEKSFESAIRMATELSKSNMVPTSYQSNIPNCLIALEIAQRCKMPVLFVVQNLHIVYGRPSWSSPAVIAMINASNKFSVNLHFEKRGEVEKDNRTYYAWTKDSQGERLDGPEVSISMAKKEGWYSRNGSKWPNMSELMLMYRSAAFFGRLYAPETLMGMHTVDEVEDFGDNLKNITPLEEKTETKVQELNEKIRGRRKKADPPPVIIDVPESTPEPTVEPTPEIVDTIPPPTFIPARALPGNNTQTDWDEWAVNFVTQVSKAPNWDWLTDLRKKNEKILNNMQKINPVKYEYCMGEYDEKMGFLEK